MRLIWHNESEWRWLWPNWVILFLHLMKAHCALAQVPRGKSAINQVLRKEEILDLAI